MKVNGFAKTFLAGAAIAAARIVKHGANDAQAIQAAAAGDASIGVSDLAAEAGRQVDVFMDGVVTVEYGGAVTRGALLTSDATGRAVAAAAGNRVIGVAMVSGVAGDLGSVRLSPGVM